MVVLEEVDADHGGGSSTVFPGSTVREFKNTIQPRHGVGQLLHAASGRVVDQAFGIDFMLKLYLVVGSVRHYQGIARLVVRPHHIPVLLRLEAVK